MSTCDYSYRSSYTVYCFCCLHLDLQHCLAHYSSSTCSLQIIGRQRLIYYSNLLYQASPSVPVCLDYWCQWKRLIQTELLELLDNGALFFCIHRIGDSTGQVSMSRSGIGGDSRLLPKR